MSFKPLATANRRLGVAANPKTTGYHDKFCGNNIDAKPMLKITPEHMPKFMRCVTATATKRVYEFLILPWLLSSFFNLPLLLGYPIMMWMLWSSAGNRSFTCFRVTRSTVNCEVIFQPLLPLPTQTTVYANVRGAGAETGTVEAGDSVMVYHSITLKTVGEEVKVWSVGSDSEARELAARIESFRKSTENQILVDSRGAPSWTLLLLFTLVPPLIIALLHRFFLLCFSFGTYVTLDRSKRQIHQKYIRPFGIRNQKTIPFSKVQQVAVQSRQDSDGDTVFHVEVQGRSPSPQPLLTLDFSVNASAARAETEQLGQFLGCAVVLPESLSALDTSPDTKKPNYP